MSLFQSNLRKQIRKLPKILKSVKIIQYYSISFNRVLIQIAAATAAIESKTERAGQTAVEIVNLKNDLEDTKEELGADEVFLTELNKIECKLNFKTFLKTFRTFSGHLQNAPTSGEYLECPAIPTEVFENLGERQPFMLAKIQFASSARAALPSPIAVCDILQNSGKCESGEVKTSVQIL